VTATLAIVNPAAGGGRCAKRAPAVVKILRESGVEIDVIETQRPGDATDIARREWAKGRRSFIGAGGDGTTYEIVNGLFPEALKSDVKPAIGFMPLGTGNSFLKDYTADGAAYAIEKIRDSVRRPIDVIRATHAHGKIYYTNLLSIGFTANVGGFVNRYFKPLGEAGYGLGVVKEVATLDPRPLPFAFDAGEFNTKPVTFLSFNNSKFTGGKMMIAPHADASDGLIEAIVVERMGRIGLLSTFPKIFKGTHVDHPKVHEHQVKSVRFALDRPIDVMVDGEVVTLELRRLDVLPLALEVMA
jgi:YegS/Rv2252/BmrU family lipid kinase